MVLNKDIHEFDYKEKRTLLEIIINFIKNKVLKKKIGGKTVNFSKDTKEYERRTDELDKVKIRCSWCGHRVIVPIKVDKRICTWCGHWVFRDKKEQFKDKLRKAMKGKENE